LKKEATTEEAKKEFESLEGLEEEVKDVMTH